MKNRIIVGLILVLMIFPAVNADIITPTVTNVYFEQNGQEYSGNIEFTMKGYGYATRMPGEPGFIGAMEPGTYTPEVVDSFSAIYTGYGTKIYENYYRNYVHINYYELEGETEDGKNFIIRNIPPEEVPKCLEGEILPDYDEGKSYLITEEYKTCIENPGDYEEDYISTYGPAEDEFIGATREGGITASCDLFVKVTDEQWSCNQGGGTFVMKNEDIDALEGGISYTPKRGTAHSICKKFLEEFSETDENGNLIERVCELRFDLDDAEWDENPEPEPEKSFFEKLACFFKSIFGRSC